MSQMTEGRRPSTTKGLARTNQTRRTRQASLGLEHLESREVPAAAVTINPSDNLAFVANTTGTVTVSYAAGIYTIADSSEVINVTNNGTGLVTGNGTNTITVTNTTALDVDLNGTASSLILQSNNNPTTLHDSAGGDDFFQIGDGSSQSINGAVTIGSTTTNSTVTIDDSADTTGRNVNVTATSVTGLTPSTIDLTNAVLSNVSLMVGTGADTITVNGTNTATTLTGDTNGDTVNVQATSTGEDLSIAGTQGEAINIGNAGSVQGILANVNITNTSASTSVNVDDSADTTARTATISATGITTGLAPAAVNYSGPGNVTIKGGSGGNTFTVASTSGTTVLNSGTGNDTVNVQGATASQSLTIHGQSGTDTVNIGNAGLLTGILGSVIVDNAGGATALAVDDSADPAILTPTITTTQITGFAAASITYSNLSSLNLMGGSGGDTFTINNAGTNTYPTTIVGGSGNDVFKLVGVATLGGGTLDGGGGTNTLDYTGYTGTVAVNLVGGAGSATGTNGVTNIQNVVPATLFVSVGQNGTFHQGDTAAVFSVIVSNLGPGPTTGTVTVVDTLPPGLAPTAADMGMINGWNVTFSGQVITATRSDTLASGASYPALTLTVSVASDAPGNVTNTVNVSGGGTTSAVNATNVFPVNSTGDLVIQGTGGDDVLVVNATGANSGTYTLNGGAAVSFDNITSFTFMGDGGNDHLTIVYPTSVAFAPSGGTHFDGGDGTDILTLNASGQPIGVLTSAITSLGVPVITYSNVETLNFINAAGVGSFAGPSAVDRSTALAGLSPDERFIQSIYLDALGRAGSQSELDGWLNVLSSGGQMAVATNIEGSNEARERLVQSWYVTYLGRAAVGGEEQGWVNSLLQGQTEEAVLSQILGSDEFYARTQQLISTGTADERYVQGLYLLLLNRSASADEVASQINAISASGRGAVAMGFLESTEFRTIQVDAAYNLLLSRPADSGADGWISSTLDMTNIRVGFESSSEFYSDAQNG